MGDFKAWVIGGAGFIGSHVVDRCLEEGMEVVVYDNFSTGKRSFLPEVSECHIIEGDILDGASLSREMKESTPDVVFHLAAIHHIPTCEKLPERALRANIEGTATVLQACAVHGVQRLVFASTGALYDPAVTSILSETTQVKAFDIYSISKLACEYLLGYHAEKADGGLTVAAARLFNTVGRRETNSHLIPAIVEQLSTGKREIRLGNIFPRRDYIHVEDVADALLAMGLIEEPEGLDIFNVGTGIEHSVGDLVNTFSDVIGEPIQIISVPELKRKVDRPNQRADNSKLRGATGWSPKRDLKQALEEIWQESLQVKTRGT